MSKWKQQPVPQRVVDAYATMAPGAPVPRLFGRDGFDAFVSCDEIEPGDRRWHISLSGPGRVPSWDELASAAHELRPGVPFVVGVPPRSWWLNVAENVLHLWELKDQPLLDQWRAERQGHTPTKGGG